eukprot:14291153-Heterocapsa_arctica.AAC.1
MARSQLGVDPSNARATHVLAERFKSILEACYLAANPGATDQVGGDHMAFAEFLVFALTGDDDHFSDYSVVIFNDDTGSIQAYQGPDHHRDSTHPDDGICLTIRYAQQHFTALLPSLSLGPQTGTRPSLGQILDTGGRLELARRVTRLSAV